MKMLIAGKIKKTEMGSDKASFKIAELCECGQHIAGTNCAGLKKEKRQRRLLTRQNKSSIISK